MARGEGRGGARLPFRGMSTKTQEPLICFEYDSTPWATDTLRMGQSKNRLLPLKARFCKQTASVRKARNQSLRP